MLTEILVLVGVPDSEIVCSRLSLTIASRSVAADTGDLSMFAIPWDSSAAS